MFSFVFKFRCFSKSDSISSNILKINQSYRETRSILINILISDMFDKLVSKCLIDQLNNLLCPCNDKSWKMSQIDSFINKFFKELQFHHQKNFNQNFELMNIHY